LEGDINYASVQNCKFDHVFIQDSSYLIRIQKANLFVISDIEFLDIHGYELNYLNNAMIDIVAIDLATELSYTISDIYIYNSTITFLVIESVTNGVENNLVDLTISNITYGDSYFEYK
jgi:DNA-binding XRE family transcriptional regulator